MPKIGPYELNRVYHGDCLELMKAIPDGSIPMIWTDPPYGHNNNEGDLNSVINKIMHVRDDAEYVKTPIANDGPEQMERVVTGMLKEAGRIMPKDSCCCCCCCGGGGPTPLFAKVVNWMDTPPLQFFHAIVWFKASLGLGWRYRRSYEFVMIAHKRGGRLLWETSLSDDTVSNVIVKDTKDASDFVMLKRPRPTPTEHPNPKPVKLIKHFLKLHTKPGDIVLDPFSGGAATGEACIQMGRLFLGFEIDKKWVDYGNDRLEAALKGQKVGDFRGNQGSLFGGDVEPEPLAEEEIDNAEEEADAE